jgi:hypothetical protein
VVFYVALGSNVVCGRSHHYCGGLPDFLGAPSSGSVFSAPVYSVFMSSVLRDAKKLLVITDFVGSLKVADFVD